MSLNINSQGNQFLFSLPKSFVPMEIEKKYKKDLSRIHSPYPSVIDFINSTVKGINFPPTSFPTTQQVKWQGKEINYRSGKSPYDTYTRQIVITFKSVASHFNYFVINDCLMFHYINTQNHFMDDLQILVLDKYREPRFRLIFSDILFTSQGEIQFSFEDMKVDSEKSFTVQVNFNFLDWEYIDPTKQNFLTKTKL